MLSLEPDARVLIVRHSAIGDVVHGLPVLGALRTALPRGFLAWVVESRGAELLREHPSLDKLIVVPRGWLTSPREVMALRRTLRALRLDATIDLQGLSKSAIAARLSGAPRRIGFDGLDGREISRWLNNELVQPTRTHVIDRNLELLATLGINHPRARFELPDSATSAAAAARILELLGMRDRFALLNPGAGWPSKLWPTDRYAAVARHLGQSHSLRSLVVWAGQTERDWAEAIVRGSGGFATLAPATSLLELTAIARRANLFVGSDTGPLHLAAAVDTPCVALFGPSPGERNGPYGTGHITLQKSRVGGSSRERRAAGNESMAAITVDDVANACDQILHRDRAARRSA